MRCWCARTHTPLPEKLSYRCPGTHRSTEGRSTLSRQVMKASGEPEPGRLTRLSVTRREQRRLPAQQAAQKQEGCGVPGGGVGAGSEDPGAWDGVGRKQA